MSSVIFTVNNKKYEIKAGSISPDTSLNSFIRNVANLPGTKSLCLEGGCGSCTVTLRGKHPVTNSVQSWAANSCLKPIFACDGLDILTIEGLGNRHDGYHPIQRALDDHWGTQCGYCSPGMVMNMHSLLSANGNNVTMAQVEGAFSGNICRCTGYRPILDAFKTFAFDSLESYELIDDIENLGRNCRKMSKSSCNGQECSSYLREEKQLTFEQDNKIWFKVLTLRSIYDIFSKIDASYMLVAGNTAHGLYRDINDVSNYIDISGCKELRSYAMGQDGLVIGANVCLTEVIEIFRKASKVSGFEYCGQLVVDFQRIANFPVRNNGTIAGNLCIKHKHRDFNSDIFIILESLNATLTIIGPANATPPIVLGCVDFLQINIYKKIILNIKLPKLDAKLYKFQFYKIMPCAQNAIGYVNAGFLLNIQDEIVQAARICFSGISEQFVHALNTERKLKGRNFYSNDTIIDAVHCLRDEINPTANFYSSAEYRINLAVSLFYKFSLNICPIDKVRSEYRTGGRGLERPVSSGTQTFVSNKELWPLHQPVRKYEGLIQCSGEAQFTNDIPNQSDQLWAAYVPATKPHAKIGKIDTTEALKIPGVRYFFSAKDIPGKNDFCPRIDDAFIVQSEEIFVGANSEILFHGQPVGLIVADTFELANFAATKVNITYVKVKKSLYSLAKSLLTTEPENPIIPTLKDAVELKATDRFREATISFAKDTKCADINNTKSLTGKLINDGQYHFTMEPQTVVSVPSEDGGIDIYSSSQWMHFSHVAVSRCLNIPQNKINMVVRRAGGAYGCKCSRTAQIACACALACFKLNRPVRFVMSLESNMTVVGKRFGLSCEYNVDVDENGKIQQLKNNFSLDYGCSMNDSPLAFIHAYFQSCYISDGWQIASKDVLTDAASNTFFRAHGSIEGFSMIETIMEHIWRTVGIDPVSVRLANMTSDNPLRDLLPEFVKNVDFYNRRQQIDEFNAKNRWQKRGIAISIIDFPLDFILNMRALISVYHGDGSVAICSGGIELGQGINTKVAQVAAYTLGVPLELINVKPNDNFIGANNSFTAGSMSSDACCFAVKKACENLLAKIKPIRDKMPNASWVDTITQCFLANIDLTSKYMASPADLQVYSIFGMSCAEIEFDVLTGDMQIKRVDIVEDTGQSISPEIDIGQVEGAFMMGVGYWLIERLIYDRTNGELLTNRTRNFKTPGAQDIPIDFRITLLQNSPNPAGVLRSKGVGEPPLCLAIVVLFALRYAIDSARKDAGIPSSAWYDLGAPTTPEIRFQNAGNCTDTYSYNL